MSGASPSSSSTTTPLRGASGLAWVRRQTSARAERARPAAFAPTNAASHPFDLLALRTWALSVHSVLGACYKRGFMGDAYTLEREAAAILDEARAGSRTLHVPGARERHRQKLQRAIECAKRVLAIAAEVGADPATIAGARRTLVNAHAARAQDARHGAGQLSRGSQRAPTADACDDGWRRVETIVVGAEQSAAEAARLALELDEEDARASATVAANAAQEARRIVDERNHAYTFHSDPGFSFGEAWHLAAAAVLDGVAIQIEPGGAQSAQAERFVRDAGLGALLVPYRSRPRAPKHLTEIVARAFLACPLSAQRALRGAFLGDAPIPSTIVEWTQRALANAPAGNAVLLWIRDTTHHPARNTTRAELVELVRRVRTTGLVPVLFGDPAPEGEAPASAVDLTLCWKEPVFQGVDMRRAQLQLFEQLKLAHGLVGQVGVTTAGMDGPALTGLPTMYLTDAANVRMGKWVGVVPGYQQIVRGEGYLEQISDTLRRWSRGA